MTLFDTMCTCVCFSDHKHCQGASSGYSFPAPKIRKALIVAQEVCSLASEVGMSEFTKRLNLLSQLRDAWAEGKNVTISPADTGLLLHRNTIAL